MLEKLNFEIPLEYITTLFLCSLFFGHAISSIFLVLFCVYSIINSKFKIYYFKNSYLIPISYFIISLVSLLWTSNINQSLIGINHLLPIIFIPIAFTLIPDFNITIFNKIITYFSNFIVAFFIVLLINGLKNYFKTNDFKVFFHHDLVSLFNDNAIYISSFVAFTFLCKLNIKQKSKKDYIIIIFLFIFLLLLASKNIIIMTLFISIILIIINLNKQFLYLFIGIIIFCTCIFYFPPLKDRFINEFNSNFYYVLTENNFHNYAWSGFEHRIFQIRIFFEMIQDGNLPFYGLGINNSQFILTKYYKYYKLYYGFWDYNFHNQYLQSYSEIGIIGLLVLFAFFINLIYKIKDNNNNLFMIISLLFFNLFFTESYLVRQKGILFFIFLYCLSFKVLINDKQPK